MSDTPKRFEDWEEVDCNECGRYWTDQCDGAKKDSKRLCNSYLPTRTVVIPEKLKALEKRVNKLYVACFLMLIIDILTLAVIFRG